LCGCTSEALRQNTYHQSKTVGDFLANQVLYNLAYYKDYYEKNNVNGLPSFVKLTTGQAQVQEAINAQVGIKIPIEGGDEVDPQISGNHQTQDNWTFVPVVDPNEISRLYYLYRAEFKHITDADVLKVFPKPPDSLDKQGRPIPDYTLKTYTYTNATGVFVGVVMTNNQPVYDANPPKQPKNPQLADIPGAIDTKSNKIDGWFSFTRPTNNVKSFYAGYYLHTGIWITNSENFFKFTLLTLGGTNNSTTTKSSSTMLLLNNNGIISSQSQ
jgi:hypothetical protein